MRKYGLVTAMESLVHDNEPQVTIGRSQEISQNGLAIKQLNRCVTR